MSNPGWHEQLIARLERIEDQVKENTQVLLRNTVSVEEHSRRSGLLEDEQRRIREEMEKKETSLETKLAPIEKHVEQVRGAIWWTGVLAAAVGLAKSLGWI